MLRSVRKINLCHEDTKSQRFTKNHLKLCATSCFGVLVAIYIFLTFRIKFYK
jgi:hypothetical protein